MPPNDFITRQLDRIISDNSPTTLMGVRGLVRFNRVPTWLIYLVIILVVGSWIPLAGAVRARFVRSEKTRIQVFQDMARQPRLEAQRTSDLFANKMAMRPPVPGTVARGDLEEDDFYHRGYRITGTNPAGVPQVEFFDGFPQQVTVDAELLARGKELWARYCYLCHGYDGYGNGPIHVRAMQNVGQATAWTPPSSMHAAPANTRTTGHVYNTINNGIRTMAGYGAQIQHPRDRWAVVAYVRALQLSQNAPSDLVPGELRGQVEVRPTTIGGRALLATDPTTAPATQPGGGASN